MRSVLVAVGLGLIAILLAAHWLKQDDIEQARQQYHFGFLIGEQTGYLLTPPEFVAQPFIRRIEWSPDGKYAVLVQTALRVEGLLPEQIDLRHRILVWSRAQKRLRVLWESPRTDADIDPNRDVRIAIFNDAPACVFAFRDAALGSSNGQPEWGVYYASFAGRTTELGRFDGVDLLAPPADAQAYLVFNAFAPDTGRLHLRYAPIEPTGKLGEARPLAVDNPAVTSALSSVLWYHDGKQLIVPVPSTLMRDEQQPAAGAMEPSYLLWNPRTNKVAPLALSALRTYARPQLLQAERGQHTLHHQGSADRTHTTWLREEGKAVLIAADSALATVSPQGDAILYVAHGAAFFRQLLQLPAQELSAILGSAARDKYRSHAKQIATALLMYVQDYDERFPPALGDREVAEIIMPYVKNPDVFLVEGAFAFRYLLAGQSLVDIEDPVRTEVGYLELPDGRMVIYADGHVKWQPYR